jgi:transposase
MGRKKGVIRLPKRPQPPPFRRQNRGHLPAVRGEFVQLWRQGVPVNTIKTRLGIGRSTAYEWQTNLIQYGSVISPGQALLGRPYVTSKADEMALLRLLETHGWVYQDEMRQWLLEERGVDVSRTTMSDILKRNGWTRKKIEYMSINRSEELRRAYIEDMVNYSTEDLIFIDESIFNEKTGWRTRGYAPIGEAARYQISLERGNTWSVLPALTIDGYLPCTAIQKGYVNREELIIWLREKLLPTITERYGDRGMVIVMDNCSTHVSADVVDVIQQAGHLIKYLPPYSPDFNPIELTFALLKAWIRRHWVHIRYESSTFGQFLREAVNRSGCDRFAVAQFRHAANGNYLTREQLDTLQARLRAYERESNGDDSNDGGVVLNWEPLGLGQAGN